MLRDLNLLTRLTGNMAARTQSFHMKPLQIL